MPTLGRQKCENQEFRGHLYLTGELKAGLGLCEKSVSKPDLCLWGKSSAKCIRTRVRVPSTGTKAKYQRV